MQLTHSLHQLTGGVRGSALMPTNKQDKRDGPTTEEQKPYPGTPSPCTLRLFFRYISVSSSLSRSSHLPTHFSVLPLALFFGPSPLQLVSHLTSSSLFWISAHFLPIESKKKRERERETHWWKRWGGWVS